MDLIICYVTCWSCKFGYHNLEPHPWWGMDDVESNEYAGLEPPEGNCTCNCAQVIELEKEYEREAMGYYADGLVPDDAV